MKILFRLIDKILFTLGVLAAMQLPAFIIQYRQRIGGHLDEAKGSLASFQAIADESYDGKIELLVKQYKNSANEAFQETGDIVQQHLIRVEDLSAAFSGLSDGGFWSNLYYFVINLDTDVIVGTLSAFSPSISLQVEAWVMGLIGGIVASLLYLGLVRVLARILYLLRLSSTRRYDAFPEDI